MGDLVPRLRKRADYHMARTNDGADCLLLRESANEIDRLREYGEEWNRVANYLHRKDRAQAAEIERLRSELTRLRDVVCEEDCEIIDTILGETNSVAPRRR